MISRPIPRARIVVAAMVPFAILLLIGFGVAATALYKLLRWDRAEAVHVSTEYGALVRGNTADHRFAKRHYQFSRRDGAQVRLVFLDRQLMPDKTIDVLYDPSVKDELNWTERDSYRWARRSTVYLLLWVGLGMSIVGGASVCRGGGAVGEMAQGPCRNGRTARGAEVGGTGGSVDEPRRPGRRSPISTRWPDGRSLRSETFQITVLVVRPL